MSRIYVKDTCGVCGQQIENDEIGYMIQEVKFTTSDLQTLNQRKLRPCEVRLILQPGKRIIVHTRCLKALEPY